MNKSINSILMVAVVYSCCMAATIAHADSLSLDDFVTTKSYPCDGLTLIEKARVSTSPLAIYALKIDLASNVKIVPVNGKGKLFVGETPGDSYKRLTDEGNEVLANINGDFWESRTRMYHPTSMFVNNGYIKNYSASLRSVFYCNDKEWNIGVPKLSANFTNGEVSTKIDDFNPNTTGTKIAVFTWNDPKIKAWNYCGKVIQLSLPEVLPNKAAKGIVVGDKIVQGKSGVELKNNEVFLASDTPEGQDIIEKLTSGSAVSLNVAAPGMNGVVTAAIGGGPRLMRDGKIGIEYEPEKIGKGFCTDLHPRTAVGFDKEKKTMWFVVVDGRQRGYSLGIDLYSLASVMKDLGCYDAMNIDGGGSSSMYVRGKYINKPSDKSGPRPVANGLAVIRNKKH